MNTEISRTKDMEEDEIDLLEILRIFLGHWKLLVIVAAIVGVVSLLVARFFIAPTYRSSFTAYINNSTNAGDSATLTNADIQAARSLTGTYAEIISSRPNVENAIEAAGISLLYEDLKEGISVDDLNNTEIIEVAVITKDPKTSFLLASALEITSPEYVEKIVSGSSMMIVTHAELPLKKFGPNYKKIAAIAAMLSAVLVFGILVIRSFMDTRVKSEEELTNRYGVIVIGRMHDLLATEQSENGYYE